MEVACNMQVEFITSLHRDTGRCRENRSDIENLLICTYEKKTNITTTRDNETSWVRGIYLRGHVKLQS
jgi:hypothetical protein